MALQYIQDDNGNAIFVVLPVAEYQRLQAYEQLLTTDSKQEQDWQDVPFVAGENDDALIPHEVVSVMVDEEISLLAAWRVYRKMSQAEVAHLTGLTQSAISQAEKKGSKPQAKTCKRLAKVYACSPKQLVF